MFLLVPVMNIIRFCENSVLGTIYIAISILEVGGRGGGYKIHVTFYLFIIQKMKKMHELDLY